MYNKSWFPCIFFRAGLTSEGIITITKPYHLCETGQSISNVRGHPLKKGDGEGR